MKKPLYLLLATLGGSLFGGQVVTFGEKDFYAVDPSVALDGPRDAGKRAFLEGYKSDLASGATLEKSMDLVSPPAWGKTVGPGTRGLLRFHSSFAGGFVCHLVLENLLPDHDYILTLNGNPERPGNSLLPTPVPGNEQERYYDFLIVRTDPHGMYDAGLGIYLKPGAYGVRLYVKDTSDFKIVLYRDFFDFSVN